MKIIRKPKDFPKHDYMVVVFINPVRVIQILVSTGIIMGTLPNITILDEDEPMNPSTLGKIQEALDVAQKLMDGKITVGASDWYFIPRNV